MNEEQEKESPITLIEPSVHDVSKDFLAWNNLKQALHNSMEPRPFYHEMDIWWCHIGLNVGFENDGKGINYLRPVLVLKGISLQMFIGIPITTKVRHAGHRADVILADGVARQAVVSQIKSFDSKRLWKKMAMVDKDNFEKIKQKAIDMIR